MICINDVLIILGSVLKEMIDLRETSGDIWNYCSIFLGCGSLLVDFKLSNIVTSDVSDSWFLFSGLDWNASILYFL